MALDTVEEDPMEESPPELEETKTSAKDLSSLTDIYWVHTLQSRLCSFRDFFMSKISTYTPLPPKKQLIGYTLCTHIDLWF